MKTLKVCGLILMFSLKLSLAEPSTKEKWSLSFTAFGPVKIGMSVKEAEKALGFNLEEVDIPSDPNECHHASNKDVLPSIGFMLVDQKIVRIGVYGLPYRTEKGAKVGMTEDQVKKLYPNHKVQGHPYDENGHYIVVDEKSGKYGLIFETDGKVITNFRAGEHGPVQWIEGCS